LQNFSAENTIHRKYLDEWNSIRNRKMLAMILAHAKNNQRIFISVGMAHLGGQSGLLQMLKHNGYSISQF
jgi:uncharacterized protein YbaP (TraB family)